MTRRCLSRQSHQWFRQNHRRFAKDEKSPLYQLLETSGPSWQEQTYHHNLPKSDFHQDEP